MKQKLSLFSLIFCITLSSTDAAIQIHPVADAMVIADSNADTNYGSESVIMLKNPNDLNNATRKGYLRFDLSAFNGSFDEASLSFVINRNNNGTANVPASFEVAVYGLNDDITGQAWAENSLTWNNAPGNDTNSGFAYESDESTFLGNITVTTSDLGGSTVSMATTALSSFLAADSDNLVTFMLARNDRSTASNLFLSSKEGSAAPYLTLVPEPSAYAAMLGLLALGFAVVCRRDS